MTAKALQPRRGYWPRLRPQVPWWLAPCLLALAVFGGRITGWAAPIRPWSGPSALEWKTVEDGLRELRKSYGLALVLYEPRSARPLAPIGSAPEKRPGDQELKPDAGPLARILSDSSLKKTLRRYVLLRLTTADLKKPYPFAPKKKDAKRGAVKLPPRKPPTVAEVFDLESGVAGLLVLDLRERIVWRVDMHGTKPAPEGKPAIPRKSMLRRSLHRFWKVNDVFRATARKIEPILEKAVYSFRAGDIRAAVLLVREYEAEAARRRMDPVLSKRVSDVIAEIRKKADKEFSEADQLDRRKEYLKALQAFDDIRDRYPLQDIFKRVAKRKAEIVRKLTLGK